MSSSTNHPTKHDLENPLLPGYDGGRPRHRRPSLPFVNIHKFFYACLTLVISIVFLWTAPTIIGKLNKTPPIDVWISSFNVTEIPNSRPIWESKISLNYTGVDTNNFDVSYDARVYLFFLDGFASTARVNSPSSIYVADGGKALHVDANITIDEQMSGYSDVLLELFIQANVMERPKNAESNLEIRTSFVMINCNYLRMEFEGENPRLGKLGNGGKCRVETCGSIATLFGHGKD